MIAEEASVLARGEIERVLILLNKEQKIEILRNSLEKEALQRVVNR